MAGATKYVAAFVGLFLLGGIASSCSSKPAPTVAGGKCSADGDCESGLACLDYAFMPAAGGCQVNGKQCSKTCVTDDDCVMVKSNFRCKAGCAAGLVTCQ